MSENTGESPGKIHSLEPTRVSLTDEVESARILLQEGLYEEAKKILYRALILSPHFKKAQEILSQIQKKELDQILDSHPRPQAKSSFEDPDEVIRKLNDDLGLELGRESIDPHLENWNYSAELSGKDHFDLGVAFFEMGCFRDAIRELQKSIRVVRQEFTDLGELGVSALALCAECFLGLNEAFEAKMILEPAISDAELQHEEKTPLYYLMGRVEEALGNRSEAKAWYGKVLLTDSFYRDAAFRVKTL